MSRHLNDVKNKLSYLHSNINVLDLLMEFERTMDNAGVYGYQNWMEGEIVEGPEIDRYWVTVDFMFPYSMMPDPMGGMRLTKLGCNVKYRKDAFEVPVTITGRQSYQDFTKKTAKLKKHKVWLVSVRMPKRFLDERLLDIIASNGEENNIEVNTSDISDAYDVDVDTEDFGGDMASEGGEDMGEEM